VRKHPCIADAYKNGADDMPPNESEGAIPVMRKHPCIADAYYYFNFRRLI